MPDYPVSLTVDAHVATVTIRRPARLNALDGQTLRDLGSAFGRIATNPSVGAVVVTGEGRAFSAGGDVKEWAAEDESVTADVEDDWMSLSHRMITRLYHMPKPVIAAVNGVAVGAGLDLALACDFRYASDAARFGSVYITIGYPPDVGGSFLLPRLVGMAKAKEMIYTGRIIDAHEALEIGLVQKVLPQEALLREATAFASELASGPRVAIGLAKANIQAHLSSDSLEMALRNENLSGRFCSITEDHREALVAVNEKRQPQFKGQ